MSLGGRLRFHRRVKGKVVPKSERVFKLSGKISAADWAEFLQQVRAAAKRKGIEIKEEK